MIVKEIKKVLKPKFYYLLLILPLVISSGDCFAQTGKIRSGGIYTLKSKWSGKLLDVSNASIDNNASVDCWTDTKSDAERWKVTSIGNNTYILTNVASGKLLHINVTSTDSPKVDQYGGIVNNDVKWKIEKTENKLYHLISLGNPDFSLSLNSGVQDGAKVNLTRSSGGDAQKWYFQEATQHAFSSASIADKSFTAWYTKYGVDTAKGFWDKAEMMEIVLDALEVTKDVKYEAIFNTMYNNFIIHNKTDWMYNKYNDDITWAVLASVRGSILTGNKAYLEKGREQFDKMYARAFTNLYGGGLNWYETRTSKNACINGPAIVACCYLAQATGDKTYYDKAIALYTWSKLYLLNAATGKVNDNVDLDKRSQKLRVSDWSSTYNQGTYLAAAVMLYQYTKESSYLDEAKKIARYTKDNMYNGGVINNEDGGNDLPGFKGIFARYARIYAIEGKQDDLNEWLKLNAKAAYNNRNSEGIIQTKWGTRTSETKPGSAFGASTAVSLLINSLVLQL
ncbi:glycoside hydrolase family 76 protein [Mucilaginibacter sp. E4BP6]|uniref:glycoside hydrolase family 76 protein n=1 Tax=Mucilaginibacter sp. E4BP6 TaxID=2723089 RepID=UPI0015CB63CD|nr:glycoside hydrolase family 76 protein [Mucilaginibacter sp. E4BP6]NYE66931.1 putative alpha-1,6-mannanase (GH76 family) [Mucilaginibacter sp. E4BP6]